MSQVGNVFEQRDFHLAGDRKLTAKGGYLTVDWVTALTQRLQRRLEMSPGAIYHRPTFGAGIKDYLNKPMPPRVIREIKSRVRAQCALEPLITSIDSIEVEAGTDNTLIITVACTASGRDLRLPFVVR